MTYAKRATDAATRRILLTQLVTARKRDGLSQRDLARRMGTAQSAVSDMERGRSYPHLATLQRYARAVGYRLTLTLVPEPEGGEREWTSILSR